MEEKLWFMWKKNECENIRKCSKTGKAEKLRKMLATFSLLKKKNKTKCVQIQVQKDHHGEKIQLCGVANVYEPIGHLGGFQYLGRKKKQ